MGKNHRHDPGWGPAWPTDEQIYADTLVHQPVIAAMLARVPRSATTEIGEVCGRLLDLHAELVVSCLDEYSIRILHLGVLEGALRRERLLDEDLRTRVVWTDGGLSAHEFGIELARLIDVAGPFGQAFPEPMFDNEFVLVERRVLKAKHLKLRLRAAGATSGIVEAIWFSAPAQMLEETPGRLRLLYQLAVERWQGMESAVLQVRHGFGV